MSASDAGARAPGLLDFAIARADFMAGADRPSEYLERRIERIAARNDAVKAFVVTNKAAARAAADQSDQRYSTGKPLSPIDGLPIGIKDVLETADMPTGMGSPIFAGRETGRDAAAVRALRQAGAIIVGKTVTTEFAFLTPGETHNPLDLTRTPGGSSSGSAAAVADGMVTAALGTQVVGSVIRPSAYCGAVAFKPSFGALNRGGTQVSLSQNHIGVHGATVADTWAVARAIAGRAGGDPGRSALRGPDSAPAAHKPGRLGLLQTGGWQDAEPAARDALATLTDRLRQAGVTIFDRGANKALEALEQAVVDARDVSLDICGFELQWPLGNYRDEQGSRLSPGLEARMAEWDGITVADYEASLAQRDGMRQAHAALAGEIDGLITLSAPSIAPVGLETTGNPVFAAPATILGAPAFSLPLMALDGLPLGLQLIGFPGRDADLAGRARWVTDAVENRNG